MKSGINVYGYVFAESGVGEHTRLLVSAIREAGIDYSVTPFTTTQSRQKSGFDDFGSGKAEFDINIIGVNADQMHVFSEHFGRSVLESRYNIALWAWEIEEFPEWMAKNAEHLDEIWANSSFSARAIAKKVDCPVHPFPLPIRTPKPPARSRHELRLPEGFLFGFFFDLDSIFARKNPLAVIEAYRSAFPADFGANLLLKSINGDRHPEKVRLIEESLSGRNDIIYRDGYVTAVEQDMLMAACDAYVSLHRSEGFGLTLAEAMALGKPVVATGYSGNLDFMNEENSFLVPFETVEIGPGCDPYPQSGVWAEPDVEAAASMMLRVSRGAKEYEERTIRGRREIAELHSPAARGRFIAQRLETIRLLLKDSDRKSAADSPDVIQMGARDLPSASGNYQAAGDSGDSLHAPGAMKYLSRLRSSWELLGSRDPMWAVLSDPAKRGGGWDLDEFLSTGEHEIDGLIKYVHTLPVKIGHERVLDFGCGLGRLTRPLAAHFGSAEGHDISQAMIDGAREINSDITNTSFRHVPYPPLPSRDGRFDLVYCRLVLQHMETEAAMIYIREFVRILKPGGLAVFQCPVRALVEGEIPPSQVDLDERTAYIEMHAHPRDGIEETISASGGRMVDSYDDPCAGAAFESVTFAVTVDG